MDLKKKKIVAALLKTDLLILMLKKFNLFYLTIYVILGAIVVEMDELVLVVS